MRRILSSVMTSLFLLPLLSLPTPAAAYFDDLCKTEIDAEITRLAIPPERIERTYTVNVYNGNGQTGGGRIDRIEGWVVFKDCKGNLVIKVDRVCRPLGNYTTYECQVPGVRNY
ncbi:MAG: hypothetical protein K9G33_08780 [Sneathiella sp.]|nr:hypothetical protein [Sneathiella sp.]